MPAERRAQRNEVCGDALPPLILLEVIFWNTAMKRNLSSVAAA
jgi:hypothetical protein